MLSTVRLLHRRLVRWVVRTFDLPARSADGRGGTRAHVGAHHPRRHRPLPHHRPRRARVLRRWQAAIGRILS
jgi:hypothetical protein